MKRVGIDIGGTFTDLVFWDDETQSRVIHKRPSTPQDPAEAGIAGVTELCEKAGIHLADIDLLTHGTTVATNLLLEHKGATVGLITTRGFRDVLHIGRKNRPLNFSHAQDVARQARPLCRRRHRVGVTERVIAPVTTAAALAPASLPFPGPVFPTLPLGCGCYECVEPFLHLSGAFASVQLHALSPAANR